MVTENAQMPDLSSRLEWFRDLKFGFFNHWGAYSQWGCIESWPLVEEDTWARADDLPPWVERGRDMAHFTEDYWALNRTFQPVHFDARAWVDAAKRAGMRYYVFTTKHHDGFCMFDTRQTDYRVTGADCPFHADPRADVTRELFRAFRAEGIGIGAYFSKADWHHPDYWIPGRPARTRNPNYDTHQEPERWDRFRAFVHAQIEELATGYGPLDILWLDAGWVRPPDQDLRMDDLAALARRHQPGLLVVDRTVGGPHENYLTPEQEIPEEPMLEPWETCLCLGTQWAFRPDDMYKPAREVIHTLVDIVAKGGNLLLNVGPQPDGQLPAAAVERLDEIGAWLSVNGEAIYRTRPHAPYRKGEIAWTRRGADPYAIYLPPPGADVLPACVSMPGIAPPRGAMVLLVGSGRVLPWRTDGDGIVVELPPDVRAAPPCRHAFAFKISVP